MQELRHRRSGHKIGLVALMVVLGMLGFIAAGSVARSATEAGATVSLRKTKLGPVLVNSRAHTLYLFAKDRNGRSSCAGSCARFWPPVLSQGKPSGGPGINASLLRTTRRSNGSLQVTYNGHPLYSYALDSRAGQTNGQGSRNFGARWWAVSARGTAVVKTPPTTSTSSTTTTNSCIYPPCP